MRRPTTIEVSSRNICVRSYSGKVLATQVLHPANVKPIFKWAGGKQWLAPAAPSLAPAGWKGTYFETFLGGAAFFLSLGPNRAVLSDTNSDLIRTYRALQADPDRVIHELESFSNDVRFYYYLRGTNPRTEYAIAARLLYLVRSCWNGLYRVNKKGQFNTPFGFHANLTICDEYAIEDAAQEFSHATLITGDFEKVSRRARRGDLVYFDPPYITGHKNNGFLKYNSTLFSWRDQERLAKLAVELSSQGVRVLISNADHDAVLQLYKGFRYYQCVRASLIAADSSNRRSITEALLSNYKIMGVESEVIR